MNELFNIDSINHLLIKDCRPSTAPHIYVSLTYLIRLYVKKFAEKFGISKYNVEGTTKRPRRNK